MNSLKNKIRNFVRVEDGLVTVEWVALTAGMVVAAIAIGFVVMNNTYDQGKLIGGGIVGQSSAIYGKNGSKLGP